MQKQKSIVFIAAFGCVAFLTSEVRGQMSEEDKKKLFLQAREDIRPVPKPSESPRPKPRPASTPTPEPTPRETSKETPNPTPEETPTPRKVSPEKEKPTPEPTPRETSRETPNPTPEETPTPRKVSPEKPTPIPESTPLRTSKETPSSTPEETPTPRKASREKEKPTPTPQPTPKPSESPDFISLPDEVPPSNNDKGKRKTTPAPRPTPNPTQIPGGKTPAGHPLDAPIVVEKSGLDEQQGYEQAPSKTQFGGFFKHWRYLTPGVRKAIDQARVQRGRWKYIIVHNSGTQQGNARVFDVYHRRVRKMQNGLAYHFVIGNGHSSGDGEIEIGNRWTQQINGGHVASDYLNNIALGICLVGDFNRDKPTKAQLDALDELITYLRTRVGKIKGKPSIVKGHKEINPKPTDCPGDRFPLGWLRQKFGS